uniref:MULE domain-containing protein n=1 Tax=Strongyloides papillosus TaxID=174720 RepID=A0A0N5BR84_STREA
MNAARHAFQDADIKGCFFHLSQSLIRKINSVVLKSVIESDIQVKLMLKSLLSLAFVPLKDVRKNFDLLSATFLDVDAYNDILTYFFSTYIKGAARRNAQFSP